MTLIDIEFEFEGQLFKSSVHRVASGPVQYHLQDVFPKLEVKNTIYTCDYQTGGLTYGVDPNHRSQLEYNIATAIMQACKNKGINLCAY